MAQSASQNADQIAEMLGGKPAELDETLERDTAVNGSPDAADDDVTNEARSTAKPAEGDNDTPPPGLGSPAR